MTPFVPSTDIERYFAWLSAIPRGSRNEQAASDAIKVMMEARGLATFQDAMGNLLVTKPAAPGYEAAAPVLLQAHLDMVCTKVPGCEHDFEKDPLELAVDEEGWLHAVGTTLGADDGYGVAYMMALLLDEGAKHPLLECLFTVQEEIGLLGAAQFDTSKIKSRRMVSLDGGGESTTTVSTCGGRRVCFSLPLEPAERDGQCFLLSVNGLTGGHSAAEIHRGRANAIQLLGHLMMALEGTGAALIHAEGGEAANAIPRDASAVLKIPAERAGFARERVINLRSRFRRLYRETDPALDVRLDAIPDEEGPAYGLACGRMLLALPNGVRMMDAARPGVVALSDNIGVLSTQDGALRVTLMIRSATSEHRAMLSEEILAAGEAFGAEGVTDSDYPGFEYMPDSPLREKYMALAERMLGARPEEEASHGGMEIGYFSRTMPGMDIVTIGPDAEGCHSPAERMRLDSFNRTYALLRALLEEMD
ncbi:MAG: aminoacyl-histidine dipeptidase [Clostridiales bacterium]|nr:aminoacyl-histidine dipeptidase [Clostridiales bacterium]